MSTPEMDQQIMLEELFAFFMTWWVQIFNEPTFHDAFPKIILEYSKKCDPDLPNGAWND